MANYAVLQLRKVDGNGLSGDQIAEELLIGQEHATWGRGARLVLASDAPQLYDKAIADCRAKAEQGKAKFELLDPREVVVRVTERRKYKRRAPRVWTGYLRVVQVDVTPRLVERVSADAARRAGIQVKGGLIQP